MTREICSYCPPEAEVIELQSQGVFAGSVEDANWDEYVESLN